MSIRYLIAAGLMASACAAHADVIPATGGAGIVSGSNVAGAVGDSSVIAGVSRAAGSDALVEALYQKVSASVGSDMKVSLRQGIDGVYVTGLSTAKAAALAGDGMSVISTADGFKIVATAPSASGAGNALVGGGASTGPGITAPSAGSGTGAGSPLGDSLTQMPGADVNLGAGVGVGAGAGAGTGTGSGAGNQAPNAVAVPEPSSIALMLAGMLGVAGLGRRRAR
jgi:hypothetical protein